MRYLIPLIFLLGLFGCGNKRGNDQSQIHASFGDNPPRTEQIPVPMPGPDYYGKLKDEIRSETSNEIRNTVQHSSDQLSGLISAKVGQLAEKVTGVELNLRELVRVEANANFSATAELRAKLETTLVATASLQSDIKAIAHLQATVTAQANLLNDMKVQLGDIRAQMAATAAAQVGLSNSLTTMQAGRDTNALTPEAVRLVLGITGGLFALLTTIICLVVRFSYKAAMLREENRTKEAVAERKQISALLMQAIGGDANSPMLKSLVRSFGLPAAPSE